MAEKYEVIVDKYNGESSKAQRIYGAWSGLRVMQEKLFSNKQDVSEYITSQNSELAYIGESVWVGNRSQETMKDECRKMLEAILSD